LAVIAVNSTDIASAAHTDGLLLRFLRLFLSAEAEVGSGVFEAASWVLRKLAHVVEYGVLAILVAGVVRALFPASIRGVGRGLFWRIARVAVPCCLVVAAVDELHQSLVASRTGSLVDVVIDAVGVVGGTVVVWLFWRRQAVRRMDGSRGPRPSGPGRG
jgi:VanZ family protein